MGAQSRVRQGRIILVLIVSLVVVVAPTSFAALSRSHAGGKVVVRIAGGNNYKEPTNGGVAGRGRFTARGAITDSGTTTTYRWVKGSLITLRTVAVGTKGTLVFVVKVDTVVGTSRWTIASGTRTYTGLHGHGTETENANYSVSILTGTVSR
jgi:hypothetical protein